MLTQIAMNGLNLVSRFSCAISNILLIPSFCLQTNNHRYSCTDSNSPELITTYLTFFLYQLEIGLWLSLDDEGDFLIGGLPVGGQCHQHHRKSRVALSSILASHTWFLSTCFCSGGTEYLWRKRIWSYRVFHCAYDGSVWFLIVHVTSGLHLGLIFPMEWTNRIRMIIMVKKCD